MQKPVWMQPSLSNGATGKAAQAKEKNSRSIKIPVGMK